MSAPPPPQKKAPIDYVRKPICLVRTTNQFFSCATAVQVAVLWWCVYFVREVFLLRKVRIIVSTFPVQESFTSQPPKKPTGCVRKLVGLVPFFQLCATGVQIYSSLVVVCVFCAGGT